MNEPQAKFAVLNGDKFPWLEDADGTVTVTVEAGEVGFPTSGELPGLIHITRGRARIKLWLNTKVSQPGTFVYTSSAVNDDRGYRFVLKITGIAVQSPEET